MILFNSLNIAFLKQEKPMHKSSILIIGACILMSAQAFAAKPSFKCSKSSHEIEKLICDDDELAGLDNSLTSLYKIVLKNTPAAAQKRLKAEQSGWVRGRNDCWKAADKRACTKGEYESRINQLKDR
jgi:uncharacterized protein